MSSHTGVLPCGSTQGEPRLFIMGTKFISVQQLIWQTQLASQPSLAYSEPQLLLSMRFIAVCHSVFEWQHCPADPKPRSMRSCKSFMGCGLFSSLGEIRCIWVIWFPLKDANISSIIAPFFFKVMHAGKQSSMVSGIWTNPALAKQPQDKAEPWVLSYFPWWPEIPAYQAGA